MVATTEREHAVMKGEYNKQIRYTCAYVGCLLSPCMLTYRIRGVEGELNKGLCAGPSCSAPAPVDRSM